MTLTILFAYAAEVCLRLELSLCGLECLSVLIYFFCICVPVHFGLFMLLCFSAHLYSYLYGSLHDVDLHVCLHFFPYRPFSASVDLQKSWSFLLVVGWSV